MIKLRYNSWKEITLNTFDKIKNIKITDELNQDEILQKNVELLSILCNVSEDEIISLPLPKFKELLSSTEWIKDIPKVNINNEYVINGKKYEVKRNLQAMTTAQYIDFQTLSKDKEKNFANMLAIFLIPKGKTYAEGYDITEVIEDIKNYFNIVDARSIMFFFILQFQSLTQVMLTYSIKELKKIAKKDKSKEITDKITELEANLTQVKDLLKNGVGFF